MALHGVAGHFLDAYSGGVGAAWTRRSAETEGPSFMDTKAWVVLAIGAVVGVCVALVSGAVRDVVDDVVDDVVGWWWDVLYAVRRLLVWVGMFVLVGLAAWAVVELVLPRLV
jgi:hypothetical protein